MAGFTPVNQVRLTNVAYVRLTKAGKRFEIAAYRNKVLSWRNKVETDLGEVLQIDTVFANVSKGLLASSKDLQDAFGTTDQRAVCREILDKGELQVSEQERLAQIDGIFRDVAGIVADKTVNPENNRPYTISMIQNAMRQIHYSVNVSKSAKSQALDVIRRLRDVMPIARAAMLLRVVCPAAVAQEMHAFLQAEVAGVAVVPTAAAGAAALAGTATATPNDAPPLNTAKTVYIDLKADPEYFRKVEEGVQALTGGAGRLEVLQLRVAAAATGGAAAPSSSSSSSSAAQPPTTGPEGEAKPSGAASSGDKGGRDKGQGHGKARKKGETEVDVLGAGIGRTRRRGGRGGDDDGEDDELARALEKLGVHGHGDGSDESDGGDNDGDDFDDDEVAFGMVTKKGAKPKKKNKGPSEQRPAVAPTQRPGTIDEEDGEEDDVEDGDDADDETRSTAAATTISTLSSGLPAADVGAARGDRKGKTARRIEKERQAEREQRASQLKARIELEQARLLKTDASTAAAASAEMAPQPASTPAPAAAAASPSAATATTPAAAAGAGQKCNTCGGCFADATAYRAHFRSEWHRHNLQRKLKGLAPIPSEEAFAALSLEELDRVAGLGQT